jgi:hypothetical protein
MQNAALPSAEKLAAFVAWMEQHLTGDEKGEAQLYLERLFQAFDYWTRSPAEGPVTSCETQ